MKPTISFCLRTAYESGFKEHPQIVMKKLGIKYAEATPQSISDSWWFWSCENLPDPLPSFLNKISIQPRQAIGWGLDEETATRLEKL